MGHFLPPGVYPLIVGPFSDQRMAACCEFSIISRKYSAVIVNLEYSCGGNTEKVSRKTFSTRCCGNRRDGLFH